MHLDYYTKGQTLALLVVVLLISFGGQYYLSRSDTAAKWVSGNAETVKNSPAFPVNSYPNAEFPISGNVIVVGKDIVVVKSGVMTYQVQIDANTKVVERTLKSPSEVSKLTAEFTASLEKNPSQTVSYPVTHNSEKSITAADFKVGDQVTVFAKNTTMFENEEFTATTVARMVQPRS